MALYKITWQDQEPGTKIVWAGSASESENLMAGILAAYEGKEPLRRTPKVEQLTLPLVKRALLEYLNKHFNQQGPL